MRLSDTATVTVVVDDVNDNSPIFDQAVYTADVEEEASMGMFVVIVTANDADSLPNAMITTASPVGITTASLQSIHQME